MAILNTNTNLNEVFSPVQGNLVLEHISTNDKAILMCSAGVYLARGGTFASWKASVEQVCNIDQNTQQLLIEAAQGNQQAFGQISQKLGLPIEFLSAIFTQKPTTKQVEQLTWGDALSIQGNGMLAGGPAGGPASNTNTQRG